MAMPTRSARTTEFGEKVPTPAEIGPGSYLGPMEFIKLRPSLTAFASSQHLSWQGKQSSLGPGPGAYDGPIPRNCLGNEGRLSFCFESRAPRLAHQYTGSTAFSPSTAVDVPGPGAYETNTAPRGELQRRFERRKPRHKNTSDNLLNRFNPPSVPRWKLLEGLPSGPCCRVLLGLTFVMFARGFGIRIQSCSSIVHALELKGTTYLYWFHCGCGNFFLVSLTKYETPTGNS